MATDAVLYSVRRFHQRAARTKTPYHNYSNRLVGGNGRCRDITCVIRWGEILRDCIHVRWWLNICVYFADVEAMCNSMFTAQRGDLRQQRQKQDKTFDWLKSFGSHHQSQPTTDPMSHSVFYVNCTLEINSTHFATSNISEPKQIPCRPMLSK